MHGTLWDYPTAFCFVSYSILAILLHFFLHKVVVLVVVVVVEVCLVVVVVVVVEVGLVAV
jgi:uncharacterized membrane protein